MKIDQPLRLIDSVINEFQNGKNYGDESCIISPNLLGIIKTFISIEILYCELGEIKPKHFLKKFHQFTNYVFRVIVTWKTRNILSYFF